MNEAQVRELTSPFDGAQLECDGMTRVLHTVLARHRVSHAAKVGRVEWRDKHFSPHFWIELPDGKVVDYRLRMWFGGSAPHGIFDPGKAGVIYEGRTANIPILSDFLFGALAGRPMGKTASALSILRRFQNDYSVSVEDMPERSMDLQEIREVGWLSFTMRRGPYFHSPDMFVEPRSDKSGTYLMTPSGVQQAKIHAHYVVKETFELSRKDEYEGDDDDVAEYPEPKIRGRKYGVLDRPVEAGVRDVVEKITRRIRDSEIARRLIEKVMRFVQTRNPADDLTPAEVSAIYRQDDYGDDFDMPGGQELDVGWTNHAEYRSDLRGIDPSKVNEAIRDFAEGHPHRHQKVNLMNRGIGKAVVEVNTQTDPEHAAVVTVMASGNDTKKQIVERAEKVKSAKVKKYVHDGLLRKIDQAGDAAAAWLEKLESDFKKLKPEGLMDGFEDADFGDLWFVITGEKRRKASDDGDVESALRHVASMLGNGIVVHRGESFGGYRSYSVSGTGQNGEKWIITLSQDFKGVFIGIQRDGVVVADKTIPDRWVLKDGQKVKVSLSSVGVRVEGEKMVRKLLSATRTASGGDWQSYLSFTPKDGGEYYTLSIPVGVEPPATGTRFALDGVSVVSLEPQTPEDIAAGRGGPVANSMRENGIAYLVNCLPEGHKWLARTASEASKCHVIYPPEPFDFKQSPEPPVVFLAGSIDMGEAEDWQAKVIEALADVPCVALNPRRKDWDSSWKQEIENPKFREQVEWELKGLEQATFIALCLTEKSKAPISLLELGLHVIGRRMIVCCPKGYWRKGNVDVVCNRYGIPVHEDFDEFCRNVKARVLETTAGYCDPLLLPAGTVQEQKDRFITASDRVAWRIAATEFIIGMKKASVRMASTVKEGDICKVDLNAAARIGESFFAPQQRRILLDIYRQGGGKVLVEDVHTYGAKRDMQNVEVAFVTAYDNPVSRIVGGVDVPVSILKVVGHQASSREVRLAVEPRRRKDGEMAASVSEVGFDGQKWWMVKEGATASFADEQQFRHALAQETVTLQDASKMADELRRQFMASETARFASRDAVCPECGQKVGVGLVPGDGSRLHFRSHVDRNGSPCKGAGWRVPAHPDKEEWGMKAFSAATTCRFGEIPLGGRFKFKGYIWKREHGKFGQRVDLIGEGRGQRSFDVKDIVEPVDGHTASDEDQMAGERMSNMFTLFHTWATRKATSLPPGAPVATQILDGMNEVEKALKGKMGLTGTAAVKALAEAMAKHFTLDAPPFPTLRRKYGDRVIREMSRGLAADPWARVGGEVHSFGSPLRRQPDYGERSGDIEERMESMKTRNVTAAKTLNRVTGQDVLAEYNRLYSEITAEGDQAHFAKVFGDRVKAVEGAVISDDEMEFRRLVSLNPGNYVGKVTRAILSVLGITRALNLSDLFWQIKERSGRVLASENLRVRVISNRIVASAKEFLGAEAWDGEIEGKHVRVQWRDRRDRDYRLTELPVPGKRRLRVRSGGFSMTASRHSNFLLMVNVIGKIMFGGVTYDQACDLIDREMKKLVDQANAEAEKSLDYKELIDGPWETQVFYLEVEPNGTKGFTAEGKDFKLEVGWNEFKGYDPASDFQQADPHYTMYKSKSATAARKMYKILRANPDALKQVAWGAFGDWMRRNGIAYDIQFSQWH